MNMRERIADWISRGAVSRAHNDHIDSLKTIMRMERSREAELKREAAAWNRRAHALMTIAACETPSANATVRRMANIAREALK